MNALRIVAVLFATAMPAAFAACATAEDEEVFGDGQGGSGAGSSIGGMGGMGGMFVTTGATTGSGTTASTGAGMGGMGTMMTTGAATTGSTNGATTANTTGSTGGGTIPCGGDQDCLLPCLQQGGLGTCVGGFCDCQGLLDAGFPTPNEYDDAYAY